jgi:hypothetical protein
LAAAAECFHLANWWPREADIAEQFLTLAEALPDDAIKGQLSLDPPPPKSGLKTVLDSDSKSAPDSFHPGPPRTTPHRSKPSLRTPVPSGPPRRFPARPVASRSLPLPAVAPQPAPHAVHRPPRNP